MVDLKESRPYASDHEEFKLNSTVKVSWDHLGKEQFQEQLQCLELAVQRPPEGPIRTSDLLWELRETHLVRGHHGNRKKNVVVAQQCFIPIDRLEDFLKGIQNIIGGGTCNYVKIRTKPAKEGGPSRATPTAFKDVTRYHCQYGPEDHTAKVKAVTASMVPKQRRKVLLASTIKAQATRKKSATAVEGNVQPDIVKKKRGPRKKIAAAVEGNVQPDTVKKKRGPRKKSTSASGDVENGKPKQTRKKKPTTDVGHIENNGITTGECLLHKQVPRTECDTEERGSCILQLPCHSSGQSGEVVNSVCSRSNSTHGSLTIDLNSVAEDPQSEEPPHPHNPTIISEVVPKKGRKKSTPNSGNLEKGKPRQTRKKKTTTDPDHSENSGISTAECLPQNQVPRMERDTEEPGSNIPQLSCHNSGQSSELSEVFNSIYSSSNATLGSFMIDLNFAVEDQQLEEPPRPHSTTVISKAVSKKGRPPQKKTVLCKRTQRPPRKAKTQKKTILDIDLNVFPLDIDLNVHPLEEIDCDTAANSIHDTASERVNVAGEHVEAHGTTSVRSNATSETSRPKKPRDSLKQWGASLKRGCLASFSVKTLFFLPHIIQICIYESDHVNEDRVQCHGLLGTADRSAFAWHLSPEIKEFVVTLLRSGMSVSQIMAKHIAVVKEAVRDKKDLTRDMFLHERDIRNWATKVAKETYMLHAEDAKSVQMWVQENPDSVFYYQETGESVHGGLTQSNIPFTIGIQTPWQREMMLKFGHESAVSIDATFGTNEKKFPLYTIMVFDEWHNGIPVAFIVTSRSAQEDLTPWMRALDTTMLRESPHWKPNAFIIDCAQGEINSLRIVWPFTAIFLCLWHVHRAWQKQACIKIHDAFLRAEVIQGLGSIMYDCNGPTGHDATTWAIQRLQQLQNLHPAANEFWDYVTRQWLPKIHMWVVGYRNLPYAGQDTNAAIENYHGYMKSILKSERSRLTGRRVDWCIHILTGDVLTHYWYQQVRKRYGFVDNKKERSTVISALIRARDIPDSDVTLPGSSGGLAYVTSTSHRHLRYVVHNPSELWATCNCLHAQKGNTCKHKVKVLRLLHPLLAEGTVARYCRALKGRAAAEKSHILSPPKVVVEPSMSSLNSPAQSETLDQFAGPHMDPHYNLQVQAKDLLEYVDGNSILMEHLEADFNRSLGKLKLLKSEIESGNLHPARANPVFHTVQDGMGMRLSRLKDMLERSARPRVSRRLV